jgi:hypothetical protein
MNPSHLSVMGLFLRFQARDKRVARLFSNFDLSVGRDFRFFEKKLGKKLPQG